MRPLLSVFAVVLALVVVACSGDDGGGASPDPAASADAVVAEATERPTLLPTADPEGEMCTHLGEMEGRLATLRAVPLRLENRVALGIELDKLMTAYRELERVDLGNREDELERTLTRLGYRLDELELAIEDFRTNTRPRRAAPHVEEDAEKVAEQLSTFVILSRC